MTTIRVMVGDDHPVTTSGVDADLKLFGLEVIERVNDGAQVLPRYLATSPDVLVLDVRFGPYRGLDIAREILKRRKDAKIVFYSQFDQDHIVKEAYKLGCKAFIPKRSVPATLAEAIEAAYKDKNYFVPEIAERIAMMSVRGEESPAELLDERELTVFKLLARGLTHAEVALELHLHPKTIGIVSQAVRDKLGLNRPVDLWRLALKYQLIDE